MTGLFGSLIFRKTTVGRRFSGSKSRAFGQIAKKNRQRLIDEGQGVFLCKIRQKTTASCTEKCGSPLVGSVRSRVTRVESGRVGEEAIALLPFSFKPEAIAPHLSVSASKPSNGSAVILLGFYWDGLLALKVIFWIPALLNV